MLLLPNDNTSMSVGHPDHIPSTTHSLTEHATRKPPGPRVAELTGPRVGRRRVVIR